MLLSDISNTLNNPMISNEFLQSNLSVYNTLSRQKKALTPLQSGKINMYVCGMTVYDVCHLGHGRMLVSFDLIRRWLMAVGYDVVLVRNITDIDDKIIKRAVENNEPIAHLTQRMIAAMHEDCLALNIIPPTHEPRATDYVPQMLSLIERLEDKGFAYQSDNGDVNYAVRLFKHYGALSGKTLDTLNDAQSGERILNKDKDKHLNNNISHKQNKRDPLDFVLWKSTKSDEPSDAQWRSARYGMGRPGWHIECSAMSCALLGETFDIHGGGPDLKSPHHDNEIAQSEAANDKTLANVWMHCGPLNVNDAKMSKSLGNFFTLRDVFKDYSPEVVRFMLVRTHYRSMMNYTADTLSEAKTALGRLYTALRSVHLNIDNKDNNDNNTIKNTDYLESLFHNDYGQRFAQAMNDDFNTPEAFAVLFEMANELNKTHDVGLAKQLKSLGGILGILQQSPDDYFKQTPSYSDLPLSVIAIEKLIEERQSAKRSKAFSTADNIRQKLLAIGIILEDTPQGTLWKWK